MNPSTAPHYASSIGQALSLLRQGKRLPISLTTDLRDQGYDIPSLHTAHLNQKA